MVQIFTEERGPTTAEIIGRPIAQGLGQGLSRGIEQYHQKKENRLAALGLGKQIGLTDQDLDQFAESFSSIPANEQASSLQKIMEAKIYQSYLGSQMQEQEQPEVSFPPKQAPEERELQEMAEEGMITQKPKTTKLGQFEFQEGELPQRKKQIPPVGILKDVAKQQFEESKESRAELRKYAEPYEDTNKLESQVSKLKEARKIVDRIPESKLRKGMIAYLEGKNAEAAEVFKSPDEQKLFSLLRPFLQTKEIGGSNPSTREVLLAMASQPSVFKGKEANKFIIDNMLKEAEGNVYKSNIIRNLRKYDPNMSPETLKDLVQKKTSEHLKQFESIIMINPQTRQKIRVPRSKMEEAREDGFEEEESNE